MTWSDTYYGHDGPWQAVKVAVGGDGSVENITSAHTSIDLLPGGTYTPIVLNPGACDPYPNLACGNGGSGNPNDDYFYSTAIEYNSSWKQPGIEGTGSYKVQAMSIQAQNIAGNHTVYNVSIASISNVTITNPDRSKRGPQLGFFALGQQALTLDFVSA